MHTYAPPYPQYPPEQSRKFNVSPHTSYIIAAIDDHSPTRAVLQYENCKYHAVFIFVRRYTIIVCYPGVANNEKDPTLLEDEDDMSPEDDEAIGMVPDGFHLRESRPSALDNPLVKRGVLL